MSTAIEWTDETWNPLVAEDRVTGKRGWFCTKVSDGCKNCYAEKINVRLGNGQLYRVGNIARIEFLLENLEKPVHWRRPRMVFVNSMTDLFHESVPVEFIAHVWAVMAMTPRHTYQVLTKRPERAREILSAESFVPMIRERVGMLGEQPRGLLYNWPLLNVWLGTSVEHQAAADERIPELLGTEAHVRFLSCEPLLGPINIGLVCDSYFVWEPGARTGIDWVIVGGESGAGSRQCDLAWLRSITQQCQREGVPVFVKQLGAKPIGEWGPNPPMCSVFTVGAGERDELNRCKNGQWRLTHRKGGWIDEFPADLKVREYPHPRVPA